MRVDALAPGELCDATRVLFSIQVKDRAIGQSQVQRLLLPADVAKYTATAQNPVSVVGNPVYGS